MNQRCKLRGIGRQSFQILQRARDQFIAPLQYRLIVHVMMEVITVSLRILCFIDHVVGELKQKPQTISELLDLF